MTGARTDLPEYVHEYPAPIPAELAARWEASRPTRTVLVDLVLFWVTAGAVLLAATAGLILLRSGDPVALAAVVVLAVVVLAALLTRQLLTRRGILRPTREIDLVVQHRHEVSLDPASTDHHLIDLARRAHRAAQVIRGLPDAGAADVRRWLVDADAEARETYVAVAHLSAVQDVTTPGAPEADALRAAAESAEAALGERVSTLERYRAQVETAAALHQARLRAEELRALTDRHLPALLTATAGHELAAARLRAALDLPDAEHPCHPNSEESA